jgi:hypothetical protein
MDLSTPAHQLVWSLLIGAETFVIAALWPLSEWATTASRGRWFIAALAVTASCIAFDTNALAFARMFNDPDRWMPVDHALAWLAIPLFLAFPAAVCVASAQSLRRAGVPDRAARIVSLLVAAFAAVIAPLAAFGAACGLQGMCF